jgi:hypothetical protein
LQAVELHSLLEGAHCWGSEGIPKLSSRRTIPTEAGVAAGICGVRCLGLGSFTARVGWRGFYARCLLVGYKSVNVVSVHHFNIPKANPIPRVVLPLLTRSLIVLCFLLFCVNKKFLSAPANFSFL